ncbi:MAG: PAS domain S-box protein [Candidatus Thiodiazotropha sp. (ex Dulcina madagascariensis)]|nr:PAS domain S-box protein [Candidatus Thiodiazotropha sp. (ex Dulcina madagascariensis)]MCU7928081.1 PAS domain S-box protein [Candidatus Thiodiazotropha sp. (ex Dulcina madagascariensis)]
MNKFRDQPLKIKMTIFVSLIVIISMGTLTFTLFSYFQGNIREEFDLRMTSITSATAYNLELPVIVGDLEGIETLLDSLLKAPDVVSAAVYDNNILMAERFAASVPSHLQKVIRAQIKSTRMVPDELGLENVMREEVIGEVMISFSVAKLQAGLENMLIFSFLVTLLIIGAAIAAGRSFIARVINPLSELLGTVQKVSNGDLTQKINSHAKDEVGQLAWSFNSMIVALRDREEALRDSEERFRKIFESGPLGMATFDLDYRLLNVNAMLCRMLDFTERDLLSISFPDITHQEDIDRDKHLARQLFNGEIPHYKIEKRYLKKDGEILWGLLTATVVRDEDGRLLYGLGMMEDITKRKRTEDELRKYRKHLEEVVKTRTTALQKEIIERKQIEESLRRAKEDAEAANRAKSTFLANMSHELRTPLNAILGFSEMLGHEPGATHSQQEKLAIINRSGGHLLGTINNVLDLSKIEAGRFELEPEATDLPRMLQDIGGMFEVRADNARLSFELELDPALARYVKTDIGKLRQVLINLLGNALKFTTEGGLILRASSRPIADDPTLVILQLEVEDSGPGIAPEQQQRIFEPFVQAQHIHSGLEGTGLGLAISKLFVNLLDGEISLESRPGEGSLFRVELPAALADAAEVVDTGTDRPAVLGLEPGQPAWRILVVEDNRENRMLLNDLLLRIGFETREAENGEQAVTLFKQWRPHFIWMDMHMPVMDGYQAAARIRALPGGDGVRIVAITASAFKEQRRSILQAGCDDVVHKPFRAHEILDAMRRQLGVCYRYEEQVGEQPVDPVVEVTAGMLETLSPVLRDKLSKAVHRLDIEATGVVIDQIRAIDAGIADGLLALTKAYRFERILELLGARQ